MRRLMTGIALTTAAAIGPNVAEAGPIDQGTPYIPAGCEVFDVGDTMSRSSEQALIDAGFSDITADGEVSDYTEQQAVYGAQKFMKDIGVLNESTRICGYAGYVTQLGAEKMLQPGDLASEEQAIENGEGSINRGPNSDLAPPSVESRYDVSDCHRYGEWTISSIKEVQEALGVYVDGDFGSQTCRAMLKFQIDEGITNPKRSDFGYLGSRTAGALGVELVAADEAQERATSTAGSEFDPEQDCPTRYSCEIMVNLTTQVAYIAENDGVSGTANGERLFEYRVQTGKPGSETNTGQFTLGPVEYGPNGNPWRLSTVTAAADPSAEPNLYKFRRIMPASGWSGEGFHGSRAYGTGAGSAGCVRQPMYAADTLAEMPTGTAVTIKGRR